MRSLHVVDRWPAQHAVVPIAKARRRAATTAQAAARPASTTTSSAHAPSNFSSRVRKLQRKGGFTYDVGEDFLEYGVQSPEVMELQWFLKAQGYFPEKQECTMFFGSITETALIKWQESVNVSVTGGFGSKSREAFLDVLVRAPPASLSTV